MMMIIIIIGIIIIAMIITIIMIIIVIIINADLAKVDNCLHQVNIVFHWVDNLEYLYLYGDLIII